VVKLGAIESSTIQFSATALWTGGQLPPQNITLVPQAYPATMPDTALIRVH
jgi:hypothetical protein